MIYKCIDCDRLCFVVTDEIKPNICPIYEGHEELEDLEVTWCKVDWRELKERLG